MGNILLPLLLGAAALAALWCRAPAYDLMVEGAAEGLRTAAAILPSMVVLMSSISMLRASGALDRTAALLAPALSFLGIPPETLLLVLVRPLSGSAALAAGSELILAYGPDSLIGRTAAVMLGSTETTFYVISVYCGSCGIRSVRYAPWAALCADAVGFVTAAASVRWLMG